jgi:hypothetical protein
MSLTHRIAVQPQCNGCEYRPPNLVRIDWHEAIAAGRAAGWIISDNGGEAWCPECLATRYTTTEGPGSERRPAPTDPDQLIDLVEDQEASR